MAQTLEGQILEILEDSLQSLVTSPPNLPIAWTGKSFSKPPSGKFLEVLFVPNITNRVFIGSLDPHQRMGILQINLHWPLGDFERIPRDVAGQIAAQFPADAVLASNGIEVRITKAPDVASALVSSTEITIPVMIEYECWA